ncbi:MAG: sigma-70 family RNA polymerase sigma factor [Phycisphaerales bacterium]|nr:sigma-70 family RNA polymerase sigma factor [Phycisphaerales bacterium]
MESAANPPDQPREASPPWSDRLLDELRVLAAVYFRSERPGHTLQPTAIVHEAWIRLTQSGTLDTSDREAFLALAAGTIRRVLVDHARRHLAQKRGAGKPGTDDGLREAPGLDRWAHEAIALEGELDLLNKLHPRSAQVCEMRYFGGLGDAEIAARLGVTTRTVRQDWATARAWLLSRLSHDHP